MYSDEYGGDSDDRGFWYENDLQLAAELGKTLLERNKELESQLRHSQQVQYDQSREVDLLAKQLDALRNVSESRMRIYEEVDRNQHELEKANDKLRHESKVDKEKIKGLTSTVDQLETRCADLCTKLDELRAAELQRQRHERHERQQRSWSSVPSLVDASDDLHHRGDFTYLGFPSIFRDSKKRPSSADSSHSEAQRQLRETLRNVRLDLAKEQRRRETVDEELSRATKNNKELTTKLQRLEKDQNELVASGLQMYADIKSNQAVCRSCRSETSSIADPELIEHDLDELPKGEVVRLKCGGSAYGSRESLIMIGLEADDYTMESGSDILVSGQIASWEKDEDADEQNNPDPSKSLLGELEVQYRRLVRKYERLIDTKSKRTTPAKEVSTQDNLDTTTASNGVTLRQKTTTTATTEVQTNWRQSLNLDLRSPIDPIEGHFDNGPPEYKRLFKEIFATLQKSATFEDGMNAQLDKNSNSSPEENTVDGKSG